MHVHVAVNAGLTCSVHDRYVLTQFNSHTLNTHITTAYPPAVFGGVGRQGFVDVLAAHQTPDSDGWSRGSADAVRRNLPAILEKYRGVGMPDELVVLSGEAIYSMVCGTAIPTTMPNASDLASNTCPDSTAGRQQQYAALMLRSLNHQAEPPERQCMGIRYLTGSALYAVQ